MQKIKFYKFPHLLKVFGGGLLTSSNLHIDADEVIVDKKGLITVTGQGYAANGEIRK